MCPQYHYVFKRKGYNIKKEYAILTSEEEVSRVISTTWHFTSLLKYLLIFEYMHNLSLPDS